MADAVKDFTQEQENLVNDLGKAEAAMQALEAEINAADDHLVSKYFGSGDNAIKADVALPKETVDALTTIIPLIQNNSSYIAGGQSWAILQAALDEIAANGAIPSKYTITYKGKAEKQVKKNYQNLAHQLENILAPKLERLAVAKDRVFHKNILPKAIERQRAANVEPLKEKVKILSKALVEQEELQSEIQSQLTNLIATKLDHCSKL